MAVKAKDLEQKTDEKDLLEAWIIISQHKLCNRSAALIQVWNCVRTAAARVQATVIDEPMGF